MRYQNIIESAFYPNQFNVLYVKMDINQPASNRTNRLMVEGVGTRVIRGPDWKWGKQVSTTFRSLDWMLLVLF